MTISGKRDLAYLTSQQAMAQQAAEAARRGANMVGGHRPRLRAALFDKARSDERFVAALEPHRRRAEVQANTPDSAGPRRSRNPHGFFGKS